MLVSSSDIVFAYTVDGATPLEDDWLSRTDGGDPLEPEENKFYVILSEGDFENFIFRFDATLDSYIMLSGGGSGNGAIYTYVVGNVPYATGWLSTEVGGDPIDPQEGPLYLVLTPGPYFSGLYRYSDTSSTYILVGNARVRDLTKAEYLNLSQAEQNDGTIYFITDSASSAPTADDYVPARVTAPQNPGAGTVILWKGAVGGDFDLTPAFYEFDGTNWQRTNLGIEGQTIQVDSMPSPAASLEGCVFQYIGTTTGNYQHGYFYECIGSGGTYSWVNLKVQDGETIQFTTLPTASQALVGKVYQFTGTTTSSFIHNYFYECVDNSGVYSWQQCQVQDGDTIQFTTMPSPSVDWVDQIIQFIGTSTNTYTKGHFYICKLDGGNYVWEEIRVEMEETVEMSLEDFDALTPDEQNNGQSYFIPDAQPESNFVARTGFTPIGTVISVMGNTAPKHYLACDGTAYQISVYPELALYFKQQFGSENYFGGDGIDTFAVPDLRGEFLRGTGTNSHTDQGSGANVGVHQDSSTFAVMRVDKDYNYLMISSSAVMNSPDNVDTYKATGNARYSISHSSDSNAAGIASTRPTNTSVLYCIAVRNIYIDVGYDYSETESVVGTWIDGKPLYQRVVTVENPATTWATFQSYGVTGIGHIVDIQPRFLIGNSWWTTPFNYNNGDQIDITCQDNGFRLFASAGVATVTRIVFIMKYTKTTD